MKPIKLNFALESNSGRSDGISGSRLVNLFPEVVEHPDEGSSVVLYGTPGLMKFTSVPNGGPILAMSKLDGKSYVVTNANLYRVNWDGHVTDLGSLEISGDRVSIATNGIQIVFVDGRKGYYYSLADGLHEISGEGWYPANTVTHQDGYFIFNRTGTGQFFITELLSVTFDPTMWATAEAAPDDSVCVISDQSILWIFGEESCEPWYNSGDSLFPFERVAGAFMEVGIRSPHTAAKIGKSVFWLGSDGVVYRTNGYHEERISTHALEYAINSASNDDAFAYTYSEEGHYFYVLTFPAMRQTWVFDTTTQLWHERGHWRFGRHLSNCYLKAYNEHLVGDYQSGTIYAMRMSIYKDDTDPIRRVAISSQIHMANQATMYSLVVDMEKGMNFTRRILDLDSRDLLLLEDDGAMLGEDDSNILLESDDGDPYSDVVASPMIMLQWSDDGKKTWSKGRWRQIGAIGEYRRIAKWGPLGMFYRRNIMITVTDPVPVVINSVSVEYG